MNIELSEEELAIKIEAFAFDVKFNENDIDGTKKRIEEVKSSATKLEEKARKMGIANIVEICKGNIPCILKKIDEKAMEGIQDMANEYDRKILEKKEKELNTNILRIR